MLQKRSLSGRLFKLWFAPVDAVRLDTFRVFIGIALSLYMLFRWAYAAEWLTQNGFHLSSACDPCCDWSVPLLKIRGLWVFAAVFFGGIFLFTVGRQVRWAALVSLIGLIYVSAADPLSFFSPNKILMCILAVFVLAPAGRYWFSSDKTIKYISAWPVRTLQAFIIIHLFMAGWSKIVFGEWSFNLYVLWTQMQGTFRTDLAAFLLRHMPIAGWKGMQMGSLLFELFAPVLLIVPSFRRIGIIGGVIFQLMIALTMKHLIYFNLINISFFALFIDEAFWHSILGNKMEKK